MGSDSYGSSGNQGQSQGGSYGAGNDSYGSGGNNKSSSGGGGGSKIGSLLEKAGSALGSSKVEQKGRSKNEASEYGSGSGNY